MAQINHGCTIPFRRENSISMPNILRKTTPISGTFLFSHPVYNFPVLFDLNYDPQDLIELNLKDLRDIYISGQKFLKFVKPNKGPILLKKAS